MISEVLRNTLCSNSNKERLTIEWSKIDEDPSELTDAMLISMDDVGDRSAAAAAVVAVNEDAISPPAMAGIADLTNFCKKKE